uniref:Uncharacterized protein n=1 Tax=Arundo donax TaxID=35708 RepID=A0A0A9FTS8_ARUDO
MYGTAQLFH